MILSVNPFTALCSCEHYSLQLQLKLQILKLSLHMNTSGRSLMFHSGRVSESLTLNSDHIKAFSLSVYCPYELSPADSDWPSWCCPSHQIKDDKIWMSCANRWMCLTAGRIKRAAVKVRVIYEEMFCRESPSARFTALLSKGWRTGRSDTKLKDRFSMFSHQVQSCVAT